MPTLDASAADDVLRRAVPAVTPAAQLVVRQGGAVLLDRCYGHLDADARERPTRPDTRFDLASLTKLFVATAFMTLAEEGRVALDDAVGGLLPELRGVRPITPYENPLAPGEWINTGATGSVDVGRITFRHLLTHTSGLPAWRPLFRQGSREAALEMALGTPAAYPTGERVLYSDIGLILLGLAIERLDGRPLDAVVAARVTGPAGLVYTGYLPIDDRRQATGDRRQATGDRRQATGDRRQATGDSGTVNASEVSDQPWFAPTELCAWRGRRVVGEVHDENAAGLGGVSGHAGIFSTARDVAAFGQLFLDGGAPLLRAETVAEMTRPQAEDGDTRRGLGWALWSPDREASGNPFGPGAFGHTGFTGTSLWADPSRGLVVALLTNDVYRGRAGRGIASLRVALHRALLGQR
jgi:CubicO group peptidase (beta-lactamase class C family)